MSSIKQYRENIWNALEEYFAHVNDKTILHDISDDFVRRLAEDSFNAKADLRNLLSRSDVWNDDLQAIVINGTKTHDPDFKTIYKLAFDIFAPIEADIDFYTRDNIYYAVKFLATPKNEIDSCSRARGISAIQELAPLAYKPNKKYSRIFYALCEALGVVDKTKGSSFQNLFAKLSDELNGRKIDFKLFVSIAPWHFLTMSNPKDDERGSILTSCHSFNSADSKYNCGCAGYARDNVTMIAFTVNDPKKAETLNNRKLTRQLFMHKPYSGILLQSRLYNTHGGTRGEQVESALYRDLIQREIAELEDIPNLWKTEGYVNNKRNIGLYAGYGFGGYVDWDVEDFKAKISVHKNRLDDFETFRIGTYGLCIHCGDEISEGLYCGSCETDGEYYRCDNCGGLCYETTTVYDYAGNAREVCNYCLNTYYDYCDECESFHPQSDMTYISSTDTHVCGECLENFYMQCQDCGEYFRIRSHKYLNSAYDRREQSIYVCDECLEAYYEECDHCHAHHHTDSMTNAYNDDGGKIRICPTCKNEHYRTCKRCGRLIKSKNLKRNICLNCKEKH